MINLPLALILGVLSIRRVFTQNTPTNATSLPVGSCTAEIPCSNGACCNSVSGFCGFGAAFCTPLANGGPCSSHCDAKAECGPDAPPENVTCPLNVCCSQFGFCGTTEEFCGAGCKSNCGSPPEPSCGVDENTAVTRRIGYYEGWATTRPCMAYPPEQISAETLTHVNFAFALISSDFQVIEMSPGDADLWSRTTALKSRNPTLKVFLSIGGWSFNDPPTSNIFSDLVASAANTDTFIRSVLSVLETYGFDGIDVDWEYPAAFDRGGVPADKANYVTFMAAVKSAFSGRGYGLTFTAPSSYWYLQHFDLPGLLKSADWVNVMTYDLHGTWDGVDPYIGYVIGAHTNLTEIDAAFKLFWNVGVDPRQMVMGMGFYGRSFTLATDQCTDGGCPWVSGGDAGPCSANSGTLMYSEIMSILSQGTVSPRLDPDAAVEILVWGGNQWVSYDDAESFAIKMNYANEHCIGGTMIWSMDQDDTSYTALKALYPGIAAAGSGVTETNQCKFSGCDEPSCPAGFSPVASSDGVIGARCPRLFCCPTDDMPGQCWWRGGATTPCNPSCSEGEVIFATQACALGGTESLCCRPSANTRTLDISSCHLADCGASCSSSETQLTVAIQGDRNADLVDDVRTCSTTDPTAICPPICSGGQKKPFCCATNAHLPVQNCRWVGTPPLCLDNACAVGQVQLLQDPQGDASLACSGSSTRAYCCDLLGDASLPVPFNDIFDPSLVQEGAVDFQAEFDPDQGVGMGTTGAGSSSSMPASNDENTEAFGEVFIDSPNAGSVSSVALDSDWVVTSCDPISDQPQKVLMYCSKSTADSGCGHVFIDGAEHTIVKLPNTCGRGPYARVASLTPHPDQTILPPHHQRKKPVDGIVYTLSFDYNFAAIPESNGPIYMRADVTDMPDYWDEVVDSPPERRQWLEERGLWKPEKRWWGSFTGWLSKINTVTQDSSVSRNFHWSDTWTIFHKSVSCPGPPAFEANLNIDLTGQAQFNSRYGFYLQATIVPPQVQAAYLYFKADASASATFTISGEASVSYDSSVVTFASFGFPGLYYPGLLTIGPSLEINGYITGQLSIQGRFATNLQYNFGSVDFQLGKTSPDVIGAGVQPGSSSQGFDFAAGYSVELSGDVSVHVVPNLLLGISVLGGAVIDANAFVAADLYAGMRLNGSVSNAVAPSVCFDAYYGIDLHGGLTGSLLYWESGPIIFPFYQNEFDFFSKCFGSVTEPSVSGRSILDYPIRASGGTLPLIDPLPYASAFILEKRGGTERRILPHDLVFDDVESSRLTKRGSVPPCTGELGCAAINDQINTHGALSDGDPYSDLDQNDLEDAFYRRTVDDWMSFGIDDSSVVDSSGNATLYSREILVVVPNCPARRFSPLPYDQAGNGGARYDLQQPNAGPPALNPNYVATLANPVQTGRIYNREHIYEVQFVARFISDLATTAPNLWHDNTGQNNFCTWVNAWVTPAFVNTLLNCLPHNGGPVGAFNGQMPWLEAVANGIKANALTGRTLRSENTFNTYTYSKKLSVMRAAAGVIGYLNRGQVQADFQSQSNCIRDTWNNWHNNVYLPNPNRNAPNAGNVNMAAVHTTWIRNVMGAVTGNIVNGLTDMQTYWSNQAGGMNVPQLVDINFGSQINQANAATQVTAADLTALINFVTANSINNWAANL